MPVAVTGVCAVLSFWQVIMASQMNNIGYDGSDSMYMTTSPVPQLREGEILIKVENHGCRPTGPLFQSHNNNQEFTLKCSCRTVSDFFLGGWSSVHSVQDFLGHAERAICPDSVKLHGLISQPHHP